MQLSEEQQKAVTHQEDPCLLLAGPGSGKTFTLIQRIAYLVRRHGVRPESILMLTFSKAAALEMKERCMRQMGGEAEGIFFGTFHSFFLRILRRYGGYESSDVVGETEHLQFSERRRGEEAYGEWKKLEGRLDYEDMERECKKLLTKEKQIMEEIQKRYPYVMVDEFQDISEIQYQILRMISGDGERLLVVGDDDQSIYGFRGASPEIMLRLREDYPSLKILHLGTNYRCPCKIVRLADRLIRHNARRYPKHLKAAEPEPKQNRQDVAEVCVYENPMDECEGIISGIRRLHEAGKPYQEIAVIARVREDLRRLRDSCEENQIPAVFPDQTGSVYEHFIFRDLWSYLKAASGNRERKYFLRILNCPERYLSSECLEDETVSFDRMCSWYGLQKEPREAIMELQRELELLKGMTVYAALQYICRKMGYLRYLRTYAEARRIPVKELYGMLDEILERAKKYPDAGSWERALGICKTEEEGSVRWDGGGVKLLTMHGSKGLEFPYVFVMGVNEGNIPSARADTTEQGEEERRLFYVAVTRTKEKLFLSFTNERSGKAARPSRFLSEMRIYSDSEYRDSK